jgi:hypothetical protein
MLVGKSILLALIEPGILTTSQLVDAIETAIIAKRQMAEDGQDVEVSRIAAGMLTALQTSITSVSVA